MRDLSRVSCHLRSYLLAPLVIARRVEYTACQSTRDDNLYYARNDKKQDGHEAKASRHDKSDYVRDDNLLLDDKGHLKKTF